MPAQGFGLHASAIMSEQQSLLRKKKLSLFHFAFAGKPIASLAFHVSADVLAIACGHKVSQAALQSFAESDV